jgi:hypothetical protein
MAALRAPSESSLSGRLCAFICHGQDQIDLSNDVKRSPTPNRDDCGYQVVESTSGRLLQLSTFGSDSRASEPKVSQTIQLDERRAGELVRIIREVYPAVR